MKRFVSPNRMYAIEPSALSVDYDLAPVAPLSPASGVARLSIVGPLWQHISNAGCFDSYEAIACRLADVLSLRPRALLIELDSPGGVVHGCFDLATRIKRTCADAGVDVYVHVDGQACSAAYAIACVAKQIFASSTAEIGSIGCVAELTSVNDAMTAQGVDVRVIGSGARKADGNSYQPITDAAESATRDRVMQMAGVFAAHVAANRGRTSQDYLALEAGVFVGAKALELGLIDGVMTAAEVIALISSGEGAASSVAERKVPAMSDDEKSAKKMSKAKAAAYGAYKAVADDEKNSDEERDEARAAMKAMDDEPQPSAEDEAPVKKDEEKKEDEAKAIAAISKRVASLEAQRDAAVRASEASERASLIASRPDLDENTRTLLASTPLDALRTFVKTAPKRAFAPAASAVVKPTQAAGQRNESAVDAPQYRQREHAAKQMRAAMGLAKVESHTYEDESGRLILGATAVHRAQ